MTALSRLSSVDSTTPAEDGFVTSVNAATITSSATSISLVPIVAEGACDDDGKPLPARWPSRSLRH